MYSLSTDTWRRVDSLSLAGYFNYADESKTGRAHAVESRVGMVGQVAFQRLYI